MTETNRQSNRKLGWGDVPLVVTDHAVEQYRRRHVPNLDYHAARSELLAAAPGAVFEREAFKGKVYLLPALSCYAILIDEGAVRTMITVLPKHVFAQDPDDFRSRAAELLAASEAADAARAEQAKAKANAKTLRQLANAGTPSVTDEIAKVAAAHYRRTITEADAKQWELGILRMEMRLANEQAQVAKGQALEALRFAVAALHGVGDPYVVLRDIERISPHFTSPAFYNRKPGEPE